LQELTPRVVDRFPQACQPDLDSEGEVPELPAEKAPQPWFLFVPLFFHVVLVRLVEDTTKQLRKLEERRRDDPPGL
jgi:hypothetical protein